MDGSAVASFISTKVRLDSDRVCKLLTFLHILYTTCVALLHIGWNTGHQYGRVETTIGELNGKIVSSLMQNQKLNCLTENGFPFFLGNKQQYRYTPIPFSC